MFVIGAGEELWLRFVPKYLQAVGATVFVIGLYDACGLCLVRSTLIPADCLSMFGDIGVHFSRLT